MDKLKLIVGIIFSIIIIIVTYHINYYENIHSFLLTPVFRAIGCEIGCISAQFLLSFDSFLERWIKEWIQYLSWIFRRSILVAHCLKYSYTTGFFIYILSILASRFITYSLLSFVIYYQTKRLKNAIREKLSILIIWPNEPMFNH